MTTTWPVKKLGDVCEIINGSTPLRSNKLFWENGKIPWFTIEDIREQGRKINYTKQHVTEEGAKKLRLLTKDSILLCCTASVGEFAISKIELTTNQQFNGLVIKDKKILLPDYLFYFSSRLKNRLLDLSGKTTIDFIPISRIKEVDIPVPPLPIQKQIVSILDEAFEKISKAKENAQQNLKNSKEVFESYLQNVFETKGEDWEESKLKSICKLDKNLNGNKNQPYVGLEQIESNTGKFIGTLEPLKVKSSTFNFNKHHILYGRLRPYLNKVIMPDFEGHCSTEIFPILPNHIIEKSFLFHWLMMPTIVDKINKTCTGARMPRANMKDVLEFKISFPKSLEEQKAIVSKLDALSEKTKQLEEIYNQKLQNLEELKQSILRKAFNQELTNKIKVSP